MFLIYLDEREKAASKDGRARNFTEGWVEFLSKRLAKQVAENLNNTQVGGKKRSKAHGVLWNIKYLPRFKWTHLTEQMALEKATHQSKMRTEISRAKREADFFKASVEKSKRQEKQAKKRTLSANDTAEDKSSSKKAKLSNNKNYEFRQKETDENIKKRKLSNTPGEAGSNSSSGVTSKSKGKKRNLSKGKNPQKPVASEEERSALLQSVFGSK